MATGFGTAELRVKGLRDLNRALARTDKDVRTGVRAELRSVGAPVAGTAERLAISRISRLGLPWSQMRVGTTSTSVYVAPRRRGARRGGPRRPNLAPLLMDKAMRPALDQHSPEIERDFDAMLNRVAANFSR